LEEKKLVGWEVQYTYVQTFEKAFKLGITSPLLEFKITWFKISDINKLYQQKDIQELEDVFSKNIFKSF
jgi:hypothetical protein